jgi:hypothetical protein
LPASDDDDDDDNGDAGPGVCLTALSVEPVNAVVGLPVEATAEVSAAAARVEYTWTVVGADGTAIQPTHFGDGSRIEFLPSEPGVYQIGVAGRADGQPCTAANVDKTVAAPGAKVMTVRLRYTPLPSQGLPPQDDPLPIKVQGGGDSAAGTRLLDPGVTVSGAIVGPSGPIGAELRLVPETGRAQRLYADAAGLYGGQLINAKHDVVVVPYDSAVAPAHYPGQSVQAVGAGYTLDAGDQVTGVVTGPGGQPVGGAWVVGAAGDLPPTVAQTSAAGTFALRVRGGEGALRLRVVPPPSSGLARLDAGAGLGLSVAAGPVELVLPGLANAEVTATVKTSSGDLAPGARVTFVAATVAGASATQAGLPRAAAASVKLSVVADAQGQVGASLPLADYAVVVEPSPAAPAGETLALTTLDLSTGPPAGPVALATIAAPLTKFVIADPSLGAVAGARVIATARGVMTVGTGLMVQGQSDDVEGAVGLALTPAMTWDVLVEPPPGGGLVRRRVVVASGGPTTVPVALAEGVRLLGRVELAGSGGIESVRVAAYCVTGCGGLDPEVPLAETVTTTGGKFTLVLPDPDAQP